MSGAILHWCSYSKGEFTASNSCRMYVSMSSFASMTDFAGWLNSSRSICENSICWDRVEVAGTWSKSFDREAQVRSSRTTTS